MWILIAGLVVFFAIHCIRIVAPDFRERQLAQNERRWKGIYSLVSLVGLGLIIWGWWVYRGEAPEIYEPPAWGRHVTMLLVLLAFILLAASNMPAGYIKTWVQHPMLTGVFLWALGHLLANGDQASLLLFGSFLVYSLLDRIAVAVRPAPPVAFVSARSDVLAIVIGVVIYAIFVLYLHGLLFGVSPLS
ncbi:NnrU family protein, required for expression of nitric oxide and nitrite reductases (Nir and Nor) [Devosia sp. H5989]|nr:NnrU family protein, required for expression of nitric oxide and nitrite reductases (Nir and Nor) [Devosia sp. H5989]